MKSASKELSPANKGPKILLLDIETSPILGYTWRMYDADVLSVVQDWKLLMVGYKWLGDKAAAILSGRTLSEEEIAEDIRELLDKADIVIGHNGDAFDIRKIQTKLRQYDIAPPSPFKSIDTMKLARAHFGFSSNKLGDLCQSLLGENKASTGGFQLWLDVMAQDPKAWKKMEGYCKRDVVLLEKLYLLLRPWAPRHPNLAVYSDANSPVCGVCQSTHLHKNKEYHTNTGTYILYRCADCGAYSRSRKAVSTTAKTIVADRR